jgi:hypothetical protein
MAGTVHTYADYELVEVREIPEYRYKWTIIMPVVTKQLQMRMVETRTWQATLTDALDDVPGSVDQGYPGSVNPGNLSSPWRLESVDYGRTQSQPMSKVVRETWVKEGAWQDIAE